MPIYGQTTQTTQQATQTRQPRTDYTNLMHNGKKYPTLDSMVEQIAKERSNVAFKSTKLILKHLGANVEMEKLAKAMVDANIEMINTYLAEQAIKDAERKESRDLFGLQN